MKTRTDNLATRVRKSLGGVWKELHTRGPWVAYKGDTGIWNIGHDTERMTEAIAEIVTKGIFALKDEKVYEANARLIAAAPELLAACKQTLFVARRYGVLEAQQDALAVAIAKAEGR